jgi:alpha-L-rhamnosidase
MPILKQEIKQTEIQPPTDLRCEYAINPLGIDSPYPRFSWVLKHGGRDRVQSAFQILVTSTLRKLLSNNGDIWDSGKVISEKSVNVEYAGKPLASAKTYYWKVRWWDNDSLKSPFSQMAVFETGLLKKNDWKARWIGKGDLLRSQFTILHPVKRARAYICGLGYYELRINGQKVGDHQLDPGCTDYDKLALYVTYDITDSVKKGENAVGIMLGNGRYSKIYTDYPLPFKQYRNASPKVMMQIMLEFGDNYDRQIFISDATWKAAKGPILANDIYDGETYDARLEKDGWDRPGYDDSSWNNAGVVPPPGGILVSQAPLPPIKAVTNINPVSLHNPRPGVYVYDFGQNFAGWVRLKVNGPKGTAVTLRHAELLDSEGMINSKTLTQARAMDIYILKGEGLEVYEPRFTYHGFRYVEVTGFPGTPRLSSLEGIVVHSAVSPAGEFQCSNLLINNLHRNIIWGQLSNLMSIPTDCCQRSERLGWTGDAHLVAEEAIFDFDMATFYTKWLRDIREAQRPDGDINVVVPPYATFNTSDPAWSMVCTVIPWLLYLYYDDRRILEENYRMMEKWVSFLTEKSKDYLVKDSMFGDWCSPGHVAPDDGSGALVSTWCYYHDVLILSRVAHILDKPAEAKQYTNLSEKIKWAFNREFIKKKPLYPGLKSSSFICGSGSQTCNFLPLYADMIPADKQIDIIARLIEDIEKNHGCHLSTGIIGTRYALDTLTKIGRTDLAYKLATQTTYPSWGYMLREGATTLWERWEYLDGNGMNSHNHIMFGSIDAWFYKTLAGINIDPSFPGFKRFVIKPHIAGDLRHVSASLQTVRGLVSSSWRIEKDSLMLDVVIPVNSQAKVSIPVSGRKASIIRESDVVVYKHGSYVKGANGISSGISEGEYVTFMVGSGTYSFQMKVSR